MKRRPVFTPERQSGRWRTGLLVPARRAGVSYVVVVLTSEWRWMQLQSVVVARRDARRVGAWEAANGRSASGRGSPLALLEALAITNSSGHENERTG